MDKVTLFVYGTLIHSKTVAAVLGRKTDLPEYTPATLHDYTKYSLNIFESPGNWVQGYIMEVSQDDMKKIDYYENVQGGLYKRINVEVELTKEKRKVDAVAYQLC